MNFNLLAFLVLLVAVGHASGEGKCLLRGACVKSSIHGKHVPCVEENDPIELEGDDLALYQKLCPHLAKGKLPPGILRLLDARRRLARSTLQDLFERF